MKNRLEIAKELLSDDGSIWINLDDNEAHYCKVLCDEVFGRDNFISNIVWQHRKSVQSDITISLSHNHILVYSKNSSQIKLNRSTDIDESAYDNPDNDPRGAWKITPFDAPNIRPNLTYPITNPNTGEIYFPPEGRCWRTTQDEYNRLLSENRIVFGKTGKSKPQAKLFLSETKEKGVSIKTWWDDCGTATEGTKELQKLFETKNTFSTPKPEKLIQKIIELATNQNDIVLDYHLGSGTTCAVAHKMGRRWIGIEQMDYIDDITKVRLQKVIEGEQGGISRAVNWTGGGSFVYFELKKYNQTFIEQILSASNMGELDAVYHDMAKNAFFKFWFDKDDFQKAYKKDKDDNQISLDERKEILINVLDENQLYLNHADMDDGRYGVSDDEKSLTHAFYGE